MNLIDNPCFKQIQAINSLRKGIEDYDRRHGWRGPITNKIKNKNWEEKIKVFKLDPTLNWQVAEIIDFNNQEINFKILTDKKNQRNVIKYKNFKWTLRKKTVSERHNIGDFISLLNFKTARYSIILFFTSSSPK